MNLIEFADLVPFTLFAAYLLVRSTVRSNRKSPFSERLARTILRLSSWLRCVGVSYDAAILRYRCECRVPVIGLDSTAEREHQEYSVVQEPE